MRSGIRDTGALGLSDTWEASANVVCDKLAVDKE
jgi:hypothetical protein